MDKIDSVFNDILNSHSGSVFDDNISDSHCCGEVEGERPGITVFVEKSSQVNAFSSTASSLTPSGEEVDSLLFSVGSGEGNFFS